MTLLLGIGIGIGLTLAVELTWFLVAFVRAHEAMGRED